MNVIDPINDHRNHMIKFVLCVLLTQFGKTFTAISKIIEEIKQDDELGRSIHIIFTMNTLLNNEQFAKRLETIETIYGKGSICVFSSKYDGKYKHIRKRLELQGLCADKSTCPRVVVMCGNARRYDDGVEFLKVIDKNKINLFRAFAYYDELHKYITEILRSQIEEINNLDIVRCITGLTASPDKIWKETGYWSKIQLIPIDNYTEANYAGCKDMIFNCVDDFFPNPYTRPGKFDEMNKQTIGYIEFVLKKHPEILGDNTKSFIPAHVLRTGHNAVRDLVFSVNNNSVVVVINGVEKNLQYKDVCGNTKTLPLISQDEEVCEIISRLVNQHNLQNRPIVITGLLCVSMGQTLTHKSLGSFNFAIFGQMDHTNDDIYQLVGRITGRIKDWGDKYVQTQVYCPTIIMNRCISMEECSRNMVEHNGDIVSQKDYREPMYEMGGVGKDAIENIRIQKQNKIKDIKKDEEVNKNLYRIYNDENVFRDVCKILGYSYVPTKDNDDGFKETSLNKKRSVVSIKDAINKVQSGYGGNKNKVKKNYRTYYPCYLDKTNKTSLHFVLIIRPETDESKILECDTKFNPISL